MKRIRSRLVAVGLVLILMTQLLPPEAFAYNFAWENALPGSSPPPPGTPGKGQPPPQCQPHANANTQQKTDPVDLQRGDYILTRQDIVLPGRIPVDLTFTYRSGSSYNGPFGYGWDMSYNRRVRKLSDGNVLVLRGDNRRDDFTVQGGSFVPGNGVFDSLVENGDGTYTLQSKHGQTESYDVHGNLTRIADRNGAALTFVYDPAGPLPIIGPSNYFVSQTSGVIARDYRLTQVTDSANRTITLSYDTNGRLQSVSWAGRTITYEYDANGDLISLTTPATPDAPSGATTAYDYEGHRLTVVTDPKGQSYLTNHYDSFGCVNQQTYGGATISLKYIGSTRCPQMEAHGDTGYGVTAKPLVAPQNSFLRVSWVTPSGDVNDQLALYRVSTGIQFGSPLSTMGTTTGSGTLAIPASAPDDLYEVRLVRSGAVKSTSTSVRVDATPDPQKTEVTDRRGFVTRYTFDGEGHITRQEELTDGIPQGEPASYVVDTTYDADGFPTRIQYPRGNAVEFRYDANGNMLQARQKKIGSPLGSDDPNDLVTAYTYANPFNLPKTVTDPRGNTTTYTYDFELSEPPKGNLRRVTLPPIEGVPPVITFVYYPSGQLDTISDPIGNVTKYTYHATTGYLHQLTRGYGTADAATTTLLYDGVGNLTSITDPMGRITTLEYNLREQPTRMVLPAPFSYETRLRYDPNGNLLQVDRQASAVPGALPALGTVSTADTWQSTVLTYTVLDRILTVKDDLAHIRTFDYDGSDNPKTVTDANSRITRYEYDERGLLTKVTDPALGITQYAYDLNGNLAQILDASSHPTNYAYDDFDRTTRVTYADSSFEEYGYDAASNPHTFKDALGRTTTFDYNGLNELDLKTYPDSTVDYRYDLSGRLISVQDPRTTIVIPEYDPLDRVKRIDTTFEGLTWSVRYGYDRNGNRTSLTNPSGSVVTYGYDELNRMTSVTKSSVALARYDYDPLSRRFHRDLLNSVGKRTTYGYDAVDRLTSVASHVDAAIPAGRQTGDDRRRPGRGSRLASNGDEIPIQPGSVIDDPGDPGEGGGGGPVYIDSTYVYGYDNEINRTSQTRTRNGAPRSFTYGYDSRYDLTSVSGAESHAYGYDALGNRQSADGVSYVPNALNQYGTVGGTAYTYDPMGNLTSDGVRTYTYDYENRLIGVTGAGLNVSYTYDPLGRRIKKTGAQTVVYRLDGANVLEETNSAGVVQASYVQGPETDEILTMTRQGATDYFFYDGLGNVADLTRASGERLETYDYDPFGRPAASSGLGNPYLFAGREYESDTGLFYNRARHYDPRIGRFLERDPLGNAVGPNLYSYVGNNPLTWTDPSGMFRWDWRGAGMGVVDVGAGAGGWWLAMRGAALVAGTSILFPELPIALALAGGAVAAWNLGTGIYAGATGREAFTGKKLSDFERSRAITGAILGTAAMGVGVYRDRSFQRYWQYYPKNNPMYQSPYVVRGATPPYEVGEVAATKLQLPGYNPGDAVREVKIPFTEMVSGNRTVAGPSGVSTGQEWYRGQCFPGKN